MHDSAALLDCTAKASLPFVELLVEAGVKISPLFYCVNERIKASVRERGVRRLPNVPQLSGDCE